MSESIKGSLIILALVVLFAAIMWAIVQRLKKIGKWSRKQKNDIYVAISVFAWFIVFLSDLTLIQKYYYEASYVVAGLLIGVIIAYICYCVGKDRGVSEERERQSEERSGWYRDKD